VNFLNEQDPKKAFKKLTQELLDGKCRWLFSFFTIVTIGLILYSLISNKEPEIYFPLILKGNAAWIVLWIALAIWGLLSIYNWKNWMKNKNI
jgi:hypothetical protein